MLMRYYNTDNTIKVLHVNILIILMYKYILYIYIYLKRERDLHKYSTLKLRLGNKFYIFILIRQKEQLSQMIYLPMRVQIYKQTSAEHRCSSKKQDMLLGSKDKAGHYD